MKPRAPIANPRPFKELRRAYLLWRQSKTPNEKANLSYDLLASYANLIRSKRQKKLDPVTVSLIEESAPLVVSSAASYDDGWFNLDCDLESLRSAWAWAVKQEAIDEIGMLAVRDFFKVDKLTCAMWTVRCLAPHLLPQWSKQVKVLERIDNNWGHGQVHATSFLELWRMLKMYLETFVEMGKDDPRYPLVGKYKEVCTIAQEAEDAGADLQEE